MSEALKRAREQAGLTVEEVIRKADVSRPTLLKAEKGKDPIRYDMAVKIVNALNSLAGTQYTVEGLSLLTSEH